MPAGKHSNQNTKYLFIFDCVCYQVEPRRSNTSKIFPFVYPLGATLCAGGLRMQSETLSFSESCKQIVYQLMWLQFHTRKDTDSLWVVCLSKQLI